jgi:hypothetical protein
MSQTIMDSGSVLIWVGLFWPKTYFDVGVLGVDLTDHPKAKRAYGWSEMPASGERFFAVLETPPIKSALDAVRALIVADAKGKK